MTLISAPAGSGKTMLVSTWLDGGRDVAWVGVERDETDPIRFWAAVMDALRASGAVAGDDPLATLTPAPAGGQDEFLARLLDGLDRLPGELLLVIDDLHELRSAAAIQGLEQLLGAAPIQLRTIVISRRDPKLGLHRLRLAGDLLELRAADLHFTAEEAGELLAGSGIDVAASDVSRLHERTEGWAAGLRLAALSLARHDAPARFVAEFSGSERTVADYLLDEVLASQPPEVRSLLLRTCILERVNGPLADLLTGRADGARLLHELEEANAFVVAVDVARTWPAGAATGCTGALIVLDLDGFRASQRRPRTRARATACCVRVAQTLSNRAARDRPAGAASAATSSPCCCPRARPAEAGAGLPGARGGDPRRGARRPATGASRRASATRPSRRR